MGLLQLPFTLQYSLNLPNIVFTQHVNGNLLYLYTSDPSGEDPIWQNNLFIELFNPDLADQIYDLITSNAVAQQTQLEVWSDDVNENNIYYWNDNFEFDVQNTIEHQSPYLESRYNNAENFQLKIYNKIMGISTTILYNTC